MSFLPWAIAVSLEQAYPIFPVGGLVKGVCLHPSVAGLLDGLTAPF